MSLSGKNKKKIIIIGGGISGLATLHYLKIKHYFNKNVDVQLLEKRDHVGGTIRSIESNGYLFETGPNGFLDNKPRTLEFIKELNLEGDVIHADESAKMRYISVSNTLHKFPTNPKDFFSFKLLNPLQKLRILGEITTPRGRNVYETVYDFGKRRLGKRFVEIFLDPMVSGIYGGDVHQTILSAAFPRIHQLEQEYGSLFRAMGKLKRKRKQKTADTIGAPTGTLTSFEKGMTQIIDTLKSRYQKSIFLNQQVQTISVRQKQYIIYSGNKQYVADEIFLSVPAYEAASLIKGIDQNLTKNLTEITYAPMAVIGLVFPKNTFDQALEGFGYLIPSLEKKEVLGVLFDSNI
ncbi:Protoporphyrinogen IX oxidase, aerobic, HemY, partial [hydrothermal vent metagenome]